MATFSYKTMSGSNAGTIDAPDRAAAARMLIRRGETPVSIEQVGLLGGGDSTLSSLSESKSLRTRAKLDTDSTSAPINWSLKSRRIMSRAEVATFIRELATALSAGLPLISSLRTMTSQGRNERQKAMLESVIASVEQGKGLADAFTPFTSSFGELTVNLMRAGEVSGRLSEVLAQAADLLDKDLKLRRSITGAILYPFIILVLVTIAIIVVVTFIVPNILKQLAGQATELPWPTRVVQGFGEFFGSLWFGFVPGWLAMLGLAFVAFVGFRSYYASPDGRYKVDHALMRMPILGRLLRDVAVARFTRTLGTLTGAGIPILTALKVTKGTLGNRAMEQVIDEVAEQVTSGKTIADPLEKSGFFPPMLVQVVNLGERSGKLDQMLSNAAHAFEERTEQSVKLFTTALPPVLVVFLACIVGFIVMAILLALLQVQESAMMS